MGCWVCFIGGIVDVIEEIRADELEALKIAIGIAKVMFAGFIGGLTFILFLILSRKLK